MGFSPSGCPNLFRAVLVPRVSQMLARHSVEVALDQRFFYDRPQREFWCGRVAEVLFFE